MKKVLFYLLILLLPTQLGLHFWPDFSYLNGLRVDYLSPTIYLTDILIVLLIIFSYKDFKNKKDLNRFIIPIVITIMSLVISSYFAINKAISFYGIIKFIELSAFAYLLSQNYEILKRKIAVLFSASVIFESSLAIAQFVNQGSINGIFYYFGERYFNSYTSQIANASLGGELILRPYGTLPHPNVLAGFLLLSLTIIYFYFLQEKTFNKKILFLVAILAGNISLFLSLSRIAIVLWILIFLFLTFHKVAVKRKAISVFFFLLGFIIVAFFLQENLYLRFFENLPNQDSFVLRGQLIVESFKIIKENLLFGVGITNFIENLPKSFNHFNLQPVHNIFLLVLAETGVSGFVLFLFLITNTVKKIIKTKNLLMLILFVSLISLGLFDHYFLTLQQGQLLFAFLIGSIFGKKNK